MMRRDTRDAIAASSSGVSSSLYREYESSGTKPSFTHHLNRSLPLPSMLRIDAERACARRRDRVRAQRLRARGDRDGARLFDDMPAEARARALGRTRRPDTDVLTGWLARV